MSAQTNSPAVEAREQPSLDVLEKWLEDFPRVEEIETDLRNALKAADELEELVPNAVSLSNSLAAMVVIFEWLEISAPSNWLSQLSSLLEQMEHFEPYDGTAIRSSVAGRRNLTREFGKVKTRIMADWRRTVATATDERFRHVSEQRDALERLELFPQVQVDLERILDEVDTTVEQLKANPFREDLLDVLDDLQIKGESMRDDLGSSDNADFIRAIAGPGAPLNMLTPEIMQWLTKHEMLERLVVSLPGSARNGR